MQIFIKILIGLAVLLVLVAAIANFAFRNPISSVDKSAYIFAPENTGSDSGTKLRLSIMVTANAKAPEAILFEGGSWFKSRKLTHSAILVCHPEALLMFDTGLGRQIDSQFEEMSPLLKPLLSYQVTAPAVEQLAGQEFCPDRPLQIILSHLHWDHAGGIEDFPDANVWTRKEELASGSLPERDAGYLFSQFDSPAINWRELGFENNRYKNYETSMDFFGDQSVVLVPMKGHSEGSVGMFVNFDGEQRYFFTGDITWGLEGFTRPAHKYSLMRAIVDKDVKNIEEEIVRVNALMDYDPALKVVPAHDYDAYGTKVIYPDFITSR